jgi:hypothetical protein
MTDMIAGNVEYSVLIPFAILSICLLPSTREEGRQAPDLTIGQLGCDDTHLLSLVVTTKPTAERYELSLKIVPMLSCQNRCPTFQALYAMAR